jgi:hypothetical protein
VGDDLLRRDVERHGPQVDPDHPVDDRDEQDQPRSLGAEQPAEAEHDAALVLPQDADGGGEHGGGERRERDDDG